MNVKVSRTFYVNVLASSRLQPVEMTLSKAAASLLPVSVITIVTWCCGDSAVDSLEGPTEY
jgi:hypothetical protein